MLVLESNLPAKERTELHALALALQADLARMGQYRERARRFFQSHLQTPALIDDLVVVLDEAVVNVINHSYGAQAGESVRLELVFEEADDDALALLSIVIRDRGARGREFRPAKQLAQVLSRLSNGEITGFGLLLMHRLMDQVDYETRPDGENRLLLRKRCHKNQSDLTYMSRLLAEINPHEPGLVPPRTAELAALEAAAMAVEPERG